MVLYALSLIYSESAFDFGDDRETLLLFEIVLKEKGFSESKMYVAFVLEEGMSEVVTDMKRIVILYEHSIKETNF